MKKFIRLLAFALMLIPFLNSGCYNDNEEDLYPEKPVCDTANITYTASIAPIMQTNCNSCHNTTVASGGVITDNAEGLRVVALNGLLWSSVNWTSAYKMPKDRGKLSDCDLSKINIWIKDGAPNN